MSKKKFTPGPWSVVHTAGYICVRNDSNLIDTTITDDILTNLDDANLIAAARELLEALESVCQNCLGQCENCPAPVAIKKAYGDKK